MLLRRTCFLSLVFAVIAALTTPAHAQLITGGESLIEKLNPFRHIDPSQPVDVIELSKQLDCVMEKLRDDGLVVVKQPDVFSQARLTHFRTDFENQMNTDLAKFQLVLSARIGRLDAATTTQTTSLSAALSAPGTTAVHLPASGGAGVSPSSAPSSPSIPSAPTAPDFGPGSSFDPSKTAFANLTVDPKLNLGVDPTVYLDEKKRFLEHLNHIRRLNLGPDQNDSSGYGLYLVRLPASITPGECTYQGYGAEVAVTVEHEFTPDFLASAFRNLVINDVVDQLSPVIYEVIRSGLIEKLEAAQGKKLQLQLLEVKRNRIVDMLFFEGLCSPSISDKEIRDKLLKFLKKYIFRDLPESQTADVFGRRAWNAIADRLLALSHARAQYQDDPKLEGVLHRFNERVERTRENGIVDHNDQELAEGFLRTVIDCFLYGGTGLDVLRDEKVRSQDPSKFKPFLDAMYRTILPDDFQFLDSIVQALAPSADVSVIGVLAQTNAALSAFADASKNLNLNLSSTRNPKQIYPIAPGEIMNFFLEDNILVLAKDAKRASVTKAPRATDVRNYMRQSLQSAYDAMAYPTNRQVIVTVPPLNNPDNNGNPGFLPNNRGIMDEIREALLERQFGPGKSGEPSRLTELFSKLIKHLERTRGNFRDAQDYTVCPIAALCWAIAVDAALLDHSLRVWWIPKIFEASGVSLELSPEKHFYYQGEMLDEETKHYFQEFVKVRWPIITFAIDPVADQQNVADSFNLKRDLQLALSFAFSTGQINFSQLNTFRRQIEQSSDTIALNRTVTGFTHGNDTFGFRFTPRFQNPPNQRTNIGVIASQLIGGGPGPDYQIKKSKLEPGVRELTAVLLIPTFLPTMRMNIAGNWFKLNDPEHLIFHTKRGLEQGRQVQELRQAVQNTCNVERFRQDDLRVLRAKLTQLDAMLPMQSRVVQLPYENTASGFDLYSDGATALVPELSGYDGVDAVKQGTAADVFIYGKYINLLDTKVIVGGAFVPKTGVDIISREVVHVQIPASAIPTVVDQDASGRTYYEVYLATPNGISNRVLVPCSPANPAPQSAFDLKPDSQELPIFYQWYTGADGKTTLIVTDDPGAVDKKPFHISWDSPTGVAPKTLQAYFKATVNGQNLVFSLQANSGNKGDYAVDRQQIAVCLLQQIQSIVTASAPLPASISVTLTVQPWLPLDSMGYRIRTEPKMVKTPLTIRFVPYVTGKNALPGVTCPEPPAPPDPATKASALRSFPGAMDNSVRAVVWDEADPSLLSTGDSQLPSLPQLSGAPLIPPPGALLASPFLSSESTAAARMLEGLPPLPSALIPTVSPFSSAGALPALQNAAAGALPNQMPSIVVTPSPVVVVNSATAAQSRSKPQSRLSRLFNHGSGQGQGVPAQSPR